jgi:hypothetical protein
MVAWLGRVMGTGVIAVSKRAPAAASASRWGVSASFAP